jgi:membrane-bound metal-dependent hydrolase YbcI (DUF457 family)
MDFFSHVLTANLGGIYLSAKTPSIPRLPIIIAGVIPDIGEIIIQTHLSRKFGTEFGVYDARTSDISIASQLSTTWLYDALHSPILVLFCLLISKICNNKFKNILQSFCCGLFFHILLDFCTHGKVWALKLFFPISNQRFPIFAESIGNWWDWTPKISLPYVSYGFPLYNILYIIFIISLTLYYQKCQQNSKQL